jgi:hypothetical protein
MKDPATMSWKEIAAKMKQHLPSRPWLEAEEVVYHCAQVAWDMIQAARIGVRIDAQQELLRLRNFREVILKHSTERIFERRPIPPGQETVAEQKILTWAIPAAAAEKIRVVIAADGGYITEGTIRRLEQIHQETGIYFLLLESDEPGTRIELCELIPSAKETVERIAAGDECATPAPAPAAETSPMGKGSEPSRPSTIVFEAGAHCIMCYQPITEAKQMTVLLGERHATGALPVGVAHQKCAEAMR